MDDEIYDLSGPDPMPSHSRAGFSRRTPEEYRESGWRLMLEGDYEAARTHFLAALRLAPHWDEARDGLLESLKAKTRLYRLVQKTGLAVNAVLAGRGRIPLWLLTSIFLGSFGALVKAIRAAPESGPLLWPIFLSLCGILVLIQVADYVSTVRAWKDADAEKAMTRAHAIGAGLAAASMALTLISLGLFFGMQHFAALLAAIVFFFLAHPMESAARGPTRAAITIAALFVAAVGASGVVSVTLMFALCKGVDFNERIPAIVGWFFLAHVLGVVISGFVSKLAGNIFPGSTSFIDPSTQASNPGALALSDEKLREIHPEIYGLRGVFHTWLYAARGVSAQAARDMTREHLLYGDSRAAVVISISPLLIAAYSDDMDCVAVLQFPESLAQVHGLKRGTKLLTINTYISGDERAADLPEGENSDGPWTNFWPLIAEFLSDDVDRIANRKRAIDAEEWRRTAELGMSALRRPGFRARNGQPLTSHIPAEK